MARSKTPGPAIERRLRDELKCRYPNFSNRTLSLEFSRIGDTCTGTGWFSLPRAELFKFFFEYYPNKSEYRLNIYSDSSDDSQSSGVNNPPVPD